MAARTFRLGVPARAQRALDALQLQQWQVYDAEYVVGRRAVRVSYDRPSGDRILFEFDTVPTVDAEVEEWIEAELLRRLSAILAVENKN